jgi:arsenate reductase
VTKSRILFVCTFFGGRARIAELYAEQFSSGQIEVFSSGFESGSIHGLPLAVMEEEGFNFPTDPLVTVFERYANIENYDYVITLCDEASAEQCPMFRDSVDMVYGKRAKVLPWSVPDFLALKGVPAEKLQGAREIRDLIKEKVIVLLSELDSRF